jgi:hypothetical protein
MRFYSTGDVSIKHDTISSRSVSLGVGGALTSGKKMNARVS